MDVLPREHKRLVPSDRLKPGTHGPEKTLPSALRVIPLRLPSHVWNLDAEEPREWGDPARYLVVTGIVASSGPSRVESLPQATSTGSPSTIAHSALSISLSGQ